MIFNEKKGAPAVILVPFTRSHIAETFRWIRSLEFRRLFMMRGEISWEDHRRYFEKILHDPSQTWFAILYDGSHVGNCGIRTLGAPDGTCTLWIYIGETSCRCKGIGSSATMQLIQKAFDDMGYRCIIIHVAAFNASALKMYTSLGFEQIPLLDTETEWLNRECDVIKMRLNR